MEWNKDTIKMLRKKLRLTQLRFAELTGTTQVNVARWETGKRKPSGPAKKALTYLAQIKGISREELEKIDASDFDMRKKDSRREKTTQD